MKNFSLHFTPKNQDVKKLIKQVEDWATSESSIIDFNEVEEQCLNHCFLREEVVLSNGLDNTINAEFNRICGKYSIEQRNYNIPDRELSESRKAMFDVLKESNGICLFVGNIEGGVLEELDLAIDLGCNVRIFREEDGKVINPREGESVIIRKSINISDLKKIILERNMNEDQFRSFVSDLFGDNEESRKSSEEIVKIMFHPDIDQFNMLSEHLDESKDDVLPVEIINKSKHELPAYSTKLSSGLDLRANIEKPITLNPLQRVLVPTGIYIALPVGYEAQIRPRSGLAIKKGVTVLNSPGTIDADYRGEIGVILVNISDEPFVIEDGERICQIVIARYKQANWIPVENLSETERGTGGFGHTGTK